MKKLQWEVKHNYDFEDDNDFLETILLDNGVKEEGIKDFLNPTKKLINSPFLMNNMKEAIELFHHHMINNSRVMVRVDADCDGVTSASALIQFINFLYPNVQVDYVMNYEKQHGLTYEDLEKNTRDYYGLVLIPDASMTVKNARQIKKNFDCDIIVLDHHIVEKEYLDKRTGHWVTKEEAKEIYKENKENVEWDVYTKYCLAVNCTDGQYPNPNLSGAGVVQKFIEGYADTYESEGVPQSIKTEFLDLVSLGMNADSMDLRSLETRYYVIEGMKSYHYKNDFINALADRNKEDMKWGRYITSMSWQIAPKINGCIRYGKPKEQLDMFRAMLGEYEEVDYKPRRKSKDDPIPETVKQTLQVAMARVCDNVKSRQDSEVRKFVVELEKQIEENKLDKNSVLFVDGTKVLTKGTVSGLVANKLASKYFRPVVLMRERDYTTYGGSMRGYDKGNIANAKEFLEKAGIACQGHNNAAGITFSKDNLDSIIEKCNEMMPLEELTTVYTVDWEIPGNKLRLDNVREVAENYEVFGSTVPEPLFAITGIEINAQNILAYGEKQNFIKFNYNGISFIKKYCTHNEYPDITCESPYMFGKNRNNLRINIIGQFVLNNWEDKVIPQVKIIAFDSEVINGDIKEPVQEISNTKEEKEWDFDFDW